MTHILCDNLKSRDASAFKNDGDGDYNEDDDYDDDDDECEW